MENELNVVDGKVSEEKKEVALTDLSVVELKSIAFDQIIIRDQAQSNLSVVLEEIKKRGDSK